MPRRPETPAPRPISPADLRAQEAAREGEAARKAFLDSLSPRDRERLAFPGE